MVASGATYDILGSKLAFIAKSDGKSDGKKTYPILPEVQRFPALLRQLALQCIELSLFRPPAILSHFSPSIHLHSKADEDIISWASQIIPDVYFDACRKRWLVRTIRCGDSESVIWDNVSTILSVCPLLRHPRIGLSTIICAGYHLHQSYKRCFKDIDAMVNITDSAIDEMEIRRQKMTDGFNRIPEYRVTVAILEHFCNKYAIKNNHCVVPHSGRLTKVFSLNAWDIPFFLKCVKREAMELGEANIRSLRVHPEFLQPFIDMLGTTTMAQSGSNSVSFVPFVNLLQIRIKPHHRSYSIVRSKHQVEKSPYNRNVSIRNVVHPVRSVDVEAVTAQVQNHNRALLFCYETRLKRLLEMRKPKDDKPPDIGIDTGIRIVLDVLENKRTTYRIGGGHTIDLGEILKYDIVFNKHITGILTCFLFYKPAEGVPFHLGNMLNELLANQKYKFRMLEINATKCLKMYKKKFDEENNLVALSNPGLAPSLRYNVPEAATSQTIQPSIRSQFLDIVGFGGQVMDFIFIHPHKNVESAFDLLLSFYSHLRSFHMHDHAEEMRGWPEGTTENIRRCYILCNILGYDNIHSICSKWVYEDLQKALSELETLKNKVCNYPVLFVYSFLV